MNIRYFGQSARLSKAVVAGGFVFLSDMVPENMKADVKNQTQDVLAQIDRWPERYSSDKVCALETTVFLADMGGYVAVNEAWNEWVAAGHVSARACVQAGLADGRWVVETKVSAVQAA